MFDSIKNVLSTVAPVIASALGGPLAGAAVSALQNALNMPEADSEQLQRVVGNLTADQQYALKKADQDFKLALKQIAMQNFQLEVTDTANARQREENLSNTKWGWIPLTIQNFGALVIMSIFVMLNIYAIFSPVVDAQNQSQIFTSDIAIIMLLVGYWWGKSKQEND